jgi:hypothetical protein
MKPKLLFFFYDACWEIPAAQTLLQLMTPARTIPNNKKA